MPILITLITVAAVVAICAAAWWIDAREFATPEECLAHEARPAEERIEGLTTAQIADALARRDIALADALEAVGARCRDARLAAGDRRRKVKEATAPLMITRQAAE